MKLFAQICLKTQCLRFAPFYDHAGLPEYVPIFLREHSRAKRISLKLDRSLKAVLLQIPQPKGLRFQIPLHILKEFIQKHVKWVIEHYTAQIQKSQNFKPHQSIQVLDQEICLQYVSQVKNQIEWGFDMLRISTKNMDDFDAFVRKALRDKLKEQITVYCDAFSHQIGVRYEKITIKNVHSRWGSCSCKKNLNFNWRLIFAPSFVVRHICAHEMCHLVHMDHSKNFKTLLMSLCDRQKEVDGWLSSHRQKLYAYG